MARTEDVRNHLAFRLTEEMHQRLLALGIKPDQLAGKRAALLRRRVEKVAPNWEAKRAMIVATLKRLEGLPGVPGVDVVEKALPADATEV